MRLTEEKISPKQLRDNFLADVQTSRLQRWAEGGVFGKDMTKQGPGRNGRQYTLPQVVLAVVVRDILELTKSHTLDITLGKELRRAIDDCLALDGYVEGKAQWVKISWSSNPPIGWVSSNGEGWNPAEHPKRWRVVRINEGENPFVGADARCIIVVDLSLFIREVQKQFEKVIRDDSL